MSDNARKLARRLLVGVAALVLLTAFWLWVLKPDEMQTYDINWLIGFGIAYVLALAWNVWAVASFVFERYRIMRG